MPNTLLASAAGVSLTSGQEIAVVTITPQQAGVFGAATNQVNNVAGVSITATLIVTGATSATTCTVKLRRGSGTTGTDILATDPVVTTPTTAVDVVITFQVNETVANFNATNGQYTLTATQAGATTTARLAALEITPTDSGL